MCVCGHEAKQHHADGYYGYQECRVSDCPCELYYTPAQQAADRKRLAG
jgi:hypothetical protein